MSLVLGIDLGTQSLKTIIYDGDAKYIAASESAPLMMQSRADGSREQAAQDWLEALHTCCTRLDAGLLQRVAAIAVSGQQHGFVPLAADGRVLAPVKLWCDTSTIAECDELMAAMGGAAACIEQVGNPIAAGYTASKILWLKNHRPQEYAQLAHILLPHDYLNWYLSGVFAMECGDASGTGLLDIRTRTWHKEIIAALDPARSLIECLPALVPHDRPIGTLQQSIASVLGLPVGIPVAPGGGDNMMAAIGTGNVSSGELTLSLGTSGTLFSHSEQPVIDPAGGFAAFCSSTGGWLPLVCTMNCTVATEQVRALCNIPLSEVDAVAASVGRGADGVFTLPFYSGERTPDLPAARASLHGLTLENTGAAQLLRSAMESALYGLRLGSELLAAAGVTAENLCLTGGGAKSELWRQLAADIFNLPVRVPAVEEGAAFGAVLQALFVLQRQANPQADLAELVAVHLPFDDALRCAPSPQAAAQYDVLFQQWKSLLPSAAAVN